MTTSINFLDTIAVGETYRNDNGDEFAIVAINKEFDRVLLARTTESGIPFYVGAWGIRPGSWAQGHYFMDNLEAAVNYVLGKEEE